MAVTISIGPQLMPSSGSSACRYTHQLYCEWVEVYNAGGRKHHDGACLVQHALINITHTAHQHHPHNCTQTISHTAHHHHPHTHSTPTYIKALDCSFHTKGISKGLSNTHILPAPCTHILPTALVWEGRAWFVTLCPHVCTKLEL